MRFIKTFEDSKNFHSFEEEDEQTKIKNHIFEFIKQVLEKKIGNIRVDESEESSQRATTVIQKYYADFVHFRQDRFLPNVHDFKNSGAFDIVCGVIIKFHLKGDKFPETLVDVSINSSNDSRYKDSIRGIFNFLNNFKKIQDDPTNYFILQKNLQDDIHEFFFYIHETGDVLKIINIKNYNVYNSTNRFDL